MKLKFLVLLLLSMCHLALAQTPPSPDNSDKLFEDFLLLGIAPTNDKTEIKKEADRFITEARAKITKDDDFALIQNYMRAKDELLRAKNPAGIYVDILYGKRGQHRRALDKLFENEDDEEPESSLAKREVPEARAEYIDFSKFNLDHQFVSLDQLRREQLPLGLNRPEEVQHYFTAVATTPTLQSHLTMPLLEFHLFLLRTAAVSAHHLLEGFSEEDFAYVMMNLVEGAIEQKVISAIALLNLMERLGLRELFVAQLNTRQGLDIIRKLPMNDRSDFDGFKEIVEMAQLSTADKLELVAKAYVDDFNSEVNSDLLALGFKIADDPRSNEIPCENLTREKGRRKGARDQFLATLAVITKGQFDRREVTSHEALRRLEFIQTKMPNTKNKHVIDLAVRLKPSQMVHQLKLSTKKICKRVMTLIGL